jgi:hypothetical protein
MVLLVVCEMGPLVSSIQFINSRSLFLQCLVLRTGPYAAMAIGYHRRVLMHNDYDPPRGQRANDL